MPRKYNFSVPPPEYIETDEQAQDLLHLALRKVQEDPGDLIGFDTETTGKKLPFVVGTKSPLDWMSDTVTFWSLAFNDRGQERRWCIRGEFFQYFAPLLENSNAWFAGWNAKYDAHVSWNCGLYLWNAKVVDGLALVGLHDENRFHRGLKACAYDYCGLPMTKFMDLFPKFDTQGKKVKEYSTSLYDLPIDKVVDYASYDAYCHRQTVLWLKDRLSETQVSAGYSLWDYYVRMEMSITEILWRMERRGMLIDMDYFRSRLPELEGKIKEFEREVNRLAGKVINLQSPPQLAQLFFSAPPDGMGLKIVKMTPGNKPSVDEEVLNLLTASGNEIAIQILTCRKLHKTKSTYYDTLMALASHYEDGRIHPNFNQFGARCLPVGELVLTNRGYLPVEQVQKGDLVISHTGRAQVVTEVIENGIKPIVQVTFSNGLSLKSTENHAYYTANGDWIEAQNLAPGCVIQAHSDPELWSAIPEWGDFSVSSWGRVFNNKTQRFMTQWPKGKWGHLKVMLRRNGCQKRGPDLRDLSVHQLVARAYVGLPNKRREIRHLDGIAWNNTAANLRWGTSKQNRRDAIKHGTMLKSCPTRMVLTDKDVETIRNTPKIRGSDQRLAENLGVSREHVRDVRTGKKRKPGPEIIGGKASFFPVTVERIDRLPKEMTYGLSVKRDHSHVTGGIVTHNTGRFSTDVPNCFDDKTEVLTTEGWVGSATLRKGHIVAQWHPDTDIIDFVHPERVVHEPYAGPLVSLQNQHIDLLLTPNHRCPLVNRRGALKVVTADNYQSDHKQVHSGFYQPTTKLNLSHDLIRLVVAAQADGHFNHNRIDFGFHKKRKAQRLNRLLTSVGAQFRFQQQRKGDGYKIHRFYVSGFIAHQLQSLLTERKVLGPWILDMSREQLDVFCAELSFWDGCLKLDSMYSSSIKQNVDWAQIALTLSGRRVKVREYMPASGRVNYQLDVVKRPYSWTTNVQKTKVSFNGTVHCLTVPSGFVIVRRNGRVCITGQSQNLPTPDKDDWGIRKAFVAPTGHKLAVADYEQLEMRIMAHMSGDRRMIGAIRAGKDLHSFTVSLMAPGITYEEVVAAKKAEHPDDRQKMMRRLRQDMKAVGFGIIYGAGPPKISDEITILDEDVEARIEELVRREETASIEDLKRGRVFSYRVKRTIQKNPLLSEEKAQIRVARESIARDKMDAYFDAFPKVKEYMKQIPQACRESKDAVDWKESREGGKATLTMSGHLKPFGFVQTLVGRFRRLEDIDHSNYRLKSEAERQSVNTTIQGSAADIIKGAMMRIEFHPRLNQMSVQMLNQVHDELVIEVPEEHVEEAVPIIQECMEHPFKSGVEALIVPLPVDLKIVDRWSQAKE